MKVSYAVIVLAFVNVFIDGLRIGSGTESAPIGLVAAAMLVVIAMFNVERLRRRR